MPGIRHQIGLDVGNAFLSAKARTADTAIATLKMFSVMIEARTAARLPDPAFGTQALLAARAAMDSAIDAHMKMIDLHAVLAPIRDDWGIPPDAFGPNDTPREPDATFKPETVDA